MESQNSEKKTDPTKKSYKVAVLAQWCKKCGLCILSCPKNVFVADSFGQAVVKEPEKCIGCMLCVMRCPDFAVEVEKIEDSEPKKE